MLGPGGNPQFIKQQNKKQKYQNSNRKFSLLMQLWQQGKKKINTGKCYQEKLRQLQQISCIN